MARDGTVVFPPARKLLTATTLDALGARMAARKRELMAVPVGLVAKTAGKVRDALSLRKDDTDTPEPASSTARKCVAAKREVVKTATAARGSGSAVSRGQGARGR